MTPAPNPPPVAESVEQVDRDAAADLYAWYHQHRGLRTEAMLRVGRLDNHSFVNAFARHRAASHEAGRIAGVREGLEVRRAADGLCWSAVDDCTGNNRTVTVDPEAFDLLNAALDKGEADAHSVA